MAEEGVIRFQLRLWSSLKERLEQAAEQNRRSLNQEIVWRLEQTIRDDIAAQHREQGEQE